MNDLKPFQHGEEGTHGCCDKRLQKEGGKARCCYCVPHEKCEFNQLEKLKSGENKDKREKNKKKTYTATFLGKSYEQLERLSKNRESKLYVLIKALDLLEKAKNV